MTEANWARRSAHRLRRNAHMLWIAARDPRTPFLAKLIVGLVAAYVLSPIDLIPDFIPVFGMLDELIVVPIGLWFASLLVPDALMRQFREAADAAVEVPVSRGGALLVIGIWVMIAVFVALQLWALRFW
jgi:uncharacterized membrane protein YkvA (DUF1232 family)